MTDTAPPADPSSSPGAERSQKLLRGRVGIERAARHVAGGQLNVDYRDKVVIAKGVFNCGHLYMLRGAKTSPDDSGWFIGDAEDTDRKKSEEDLESIRVDQLIDYPYLMSALTLPTGFLVLFVTRILESVTDANNHDIYSVYR